MFHLPNNKNTLYFLSYLISKNEKGLDALNGIFTLYKVIENPVNSIHELREPIANISEDTLKDLFTEDTFSLTKVQIDRHFDNKMKEEPGYVDTFNKIMEEGKHEALEELAQTIVEEDKVKLEEIRKQIN